MNQPPCSVCSQNVTKSSGGAKCTKCHKWCHLTCGKTKYSRELASIFVCPSCKPANTSSPASGVKTRSNPEVAPSPNLPPKNNSTPISTNNDMPTTFRGNNNISDQSLGQGKATLPEAVELSAANELCSYCHLQTENSTAIKCFFCGEYEHAGCRQLNADLFLTIKSLDPDSRLFKYECESCNKRNVSFLQLKLREALQLNAPSPSLPAPVPTESTIQSYDTTVDVILKADKEKQLREGKRTNVAIFGLPESEDTSDKDLVINLTTENDLGAHLQDDDIREVVRVGSQINGSKPRVLVVKLKDSIDTIKKRQKILSAAPNLRKSTNELVKNQVYINPDRTPMQRAQLAQQRRAKSSQGQQAQQHSNVTGSTNSRSNGNQRMRQQARPSNGPSQRQPQN